MRFLARVAFYSHEAENSILFIYLHWLTTLLGNTSLIGAFSAAGFKFSLLIWVEKGGRLPKTKPDPKETEPVMLYTFW